MNAINNHFLSGSLSGVKAPLKTVPLKVISTGKALPAMQVFSNQLDAQLGKPRGYVYARSGIEYRFLALPQESQAELGAAAFRDAIKRADISASSVDLLISASAVSVQALPCTATHILRHSGLPEGTPGFDINLSCASFIVAMQVAAGLMQTSIYRRIAIVSSELASRGLNWRDEESSYLFGDGAACVIVEAGDAVSCTQSMGGAGSKQQAGVLAYCMESYVQPGDSCEIRAGGMRCNPKMGMQENDFHFHMQGRKVFRLAAEFMRPFQEKLLNLAGCSLDEIDLVIPHQASYLGMKHMHKLLGIDAAKIVDIYAQHGNQVGASIPTALHKAVISDQWRIGSKIMLIGTAASLSMAAMILSV